MKGTGKHEQAWAAPKNWSGEEQERQDQVRQAGYQAKGGAEMEPGISMAGR